ncbi:MAG: GspE/PulE family protein [Patescibacteria group bacterium]|jgi:type IV pilus assembly protein PilB
MPISKTLLAKKTPARAFDSTEISAVDALREINRGFAEQKTRTTAHSQKSAYVDILSTAINADLLSKIDADEATAALALPFLQVGKKLRVAVVDPQNPATKKYLAKLESAGWQVFIGFASREGLLIKIEEIRALQPRRPKEFSNTDAESDLKNYEEELHALAELARTADTVPAKEILNQIFVGAIRTGASDIHIQPEDQKIELRFRIDGILQKVLEFERDKGDDILNQLKFEAKLRLNVADLPQDGRMSFLVSDRKIDVRVATLPTEFGESIVCRILDSGRKVKTLEQLGFGNITLANLQSVPAMREGMLLITGPTGSGKTTTLYTVLADLNDSERKIVTLENPIEYHLKNVVQSQINERVHYGFAEGLRALLRQDPNVLMVGEIRDGETAETATQAAMTGHILLSTLHANSAIETIPRLLDLGIKPFVLVASLRVVVAQRLLRRVCKKCARRTSPDAKMLARLTPLFEEIKRTNSQAVSSELPEFLWEAKGCPVCGGSGYHGQIAIAESFQVDEPMRELILANASAIELADYVRKKQNMLSLTEDGLLKVIAGETTLGEVARVTGLNLAN